MNREDKKNAYLYCKFRDRQMALYDEYSKKHGMLLNTLLITNVLFYAKNGMTQREISARTFLSKQTVNLIVGKLLRKECVTVTPSDDNGREKLVRMTEAGTRFCEKVVRHITWAEDTAMSMLTSEEQQTLIALSRKFTQNLETLIHLETAEHTGG